MIDDFYNEEEQWERVKRWLRENGLWLLAGVLLGVGALAGWRWWEQRVEQRAQAASAKYEEVLGAFNRSDRTHAKPFFFPYFYNENIDSRKQCKGLN